MEFDKELFVEAMVEILSSLSPGFWIMLSISLGISVFNILRNLFFDYSPSCNHVSIEDDEDYVDEDGSGFENNYESSLDFILNNNEDPIKRR